jgi:hypothetical protein
VAERACRDKGDEMKTLEEAISIKEEIESIVLQQPGVTGIDVSERKVSESESNEYIIRIFVKDENITLDKLNLQSMYKGVPIVLIKREFHLQ